MKRKAVNQSLISTPPGSPSHRQRKSANDDKAKNPSACKRAKPSGDNPTATTTVQPIALPPASDHFAPDMVGVPVPPAAARLAGPYLLGPKIGASPVRCIINCLGRRDDRHFNLKLLTLTSASPTECGQDERNGKMLMHNEHSLLSLLKGERGVIQIRDFFSEWCLHEEDVGGGRHVYNGVKSKRMCLVMDCVIPHDFTLRGGGGGGGGSPPRPNDAIKYNISLQDFVIREKRISERNSLEVFYNIVRVVENLHNRHVVHRDLKLGNIVLNTRSKDIILTNFCLGKHLMGENDLLKDQRGSPAYISPEVLSGKPYQGKPSDMWALGVVLFTMLYGQFPFYDAVPHELFSQIKGAQYTFHNEVRVSEDTKGIVAKLLVVQPQARLTATELRAELEEVIMAWRAMIPPPPRDAQKVPTHNTSKSSAKKAKVPAAPSSFTRIPGSDRLLLSQLHEGANNPFQQPSLSGCPTRVDDSPNKFGRIPVTRLTEDARPLTAEEYRLYGPVIGRLRQNQSSVNTTSTTGQPLAPSSRAVSGRGGGEATTAGPPDPSAPSALADSHVLISSSSPLMGLVSDMVDRRRREQLMSATVSAPSRAEPDVEPVPVLEQESVLDLSSGRRAIADGAAAEAPPAREIRTLQPPPEQPQPSASGSSSRRSGRSSSSRNPGLASSSSHSSTLHGSRSSSRRRRHHGGGVVPQMPAPLAAAAPLQAQVFPQHQQQHHQTVSAAFAAAVAAAASGGRVSTSAVSETSSGSSSLREALQRMNPEAFARDEAVRRRASNGGDA